MLVGELIHLWLLYNSFILHILFRLLAVVNVFYNSSAGLLKEPDPTLAIPKPVDIFLTIVVFMVCRT